MAQATNYKPTGQIEVYIADEGVLGTAYTAGANWTKLPTISFSMPEATTSIEVGSQVSGRYTLMENQTSHRKDNRVWTFDTTIKGSPATIDTAMTYLGIGTSSPFVLAENFDAPVMAHGGAMSSNATILFKDAHGSAGDLQVKGCVATSVTLAQSIDSENGDMTLAVSWMTAYEPAYISAQTLTTPTAITSGFKNIKTLSKIGIDPNGAGVAEQELEIFSWELTMSRTIERIGSQDYTTNLPFGYAQTGLWECSGSITAKKDINVDNLKAFFGNDDYCVISILDGTASELTLSVLGAKINEASTDSGGSILRQVIPFNCYAVASAGNIISITSA